MSIKQELIEKIQNKTLSMGVCKYLVVYPANFAPFSGVNDSCASKCLWI